MSILKKIVDTFLQWFCIIIVAVMAIFVTYQVVTRYFFNNPSAVSEALARYLFIWLTMYGGAYVFGKREHMNLEFIRSKFPIKIKTCLEMFSELIIAVFASTVMVIGGYIQTTTQMIQADPSTQVPMGIIYSSVLGGGIFILFYFVCNEIELIKKFKSIGAQKLSGGGL
jgi:TRAP-type C4-dicarboxylate transport system permease small subunit